jgi:hypothetical protein
MNYSAHENGKICQKIQHSEFSQELQSMASSQQMESPRQLSPEAAPAGVAAASSPLVAIADSQSRDAAAGEQPLPLPPKAEPSRQFFPMGIEAPRAEVSKAVAGRARLAAVKPVRTGKPLNGDEPAFTNPLLLDRILAQLQFPAEIRQRCVASLQKHGSLSVDELFSALAGPASGGSRETAPPVVSASDVQELVNSIKMGSSIGIPGLSDLKIKKDGVYTLEELRDLLKPLTQSRRIKAASQAARRAAGHPVGLREIGMETPDSPQVAAAPEGQLERLSASRLPSFTAIAPERPSRMHRSPPTGEQERNEQQAGNHRVGAPSVKPEARSQSAYDISSGPRVHATPRGAKQDRFDPDFVSPIPSKSGAEAPVEEISAPPRPVQAPSQKTEGTVFSWDRSTGGKHSPHPARIQEPLSGSVAVSAMAVDAQNEDGSGPVEGLSDNTADFKVDSLSGGDPFDGPDSKDPGSPSPGRQDRGNDPNGFQGGREADTAAGPGRPRSETPFSVVSSSSGVETHPRADVRTERINIQHPGWTEKLSEQVMERARSGKSSLVVEFEPLDLGHMTLRIEADQRQVTAWISTQTEEARTLLLQNTTALQKHLAEHGLSLGQLTVNVSDGRGGTRGNVDHRNGRRTSRIGARPGREPQGAPVAPGIHSRLMGQGGHQTISLTV